MPGRHSAPVHPARRAVPWLIAVAVVVVVAWFVWPRGGNVPAAKGTRTPRLTLPSTVQTPAGRMHSPSVAVGPSRSPRPSQAPSKGGQPHAPKPEIVWKPIPFSEKRKQQMVVYAKRHYGMDAWQLKDPKVIVEHFTAGSAFESAFATFASNKPDLGELPGTCAHFVVDRDGTIYQLVKLDAMCRHTVGLNYTAIGIEMVGMSDAQVMRDHKQYEAAQNLTLWLMQRYGIALDNVIGHSESLTSPYHQEAVKSWQCQTHADWIHSDMQVFRKDLAALANRFDVPLGKPVKRVNPNC